MRFGVALVIACVPGGAAAEPETSPIRDSSYALELYDNAVLGNAAVVGMGGAAVALATGTAGTLFNPSAPAVRLTTDNDSWSWDYHLDYLNGSLSTDDDNNGFSSETGRSVATLGLGLRVGDWAGAITGIGQGAPTDATVLAGIGMTEQPVTATTFRMQLALARWIDSLDMSIGAAITTALFEIGPDCTGAGCDPLFTISGAGLDVGGTWVPRQRSLRVGAMVSSPIRGGDTSATCDPSDCLGYILPERVVSPWRLAVGGAYRFAPTAWNQQVQRPFRDERAVTVAADLLVLGPSDNAYGLEAFSNNLLQRSGRHHSVSVRTGVEYEWKPGRLRVRGGGYWEPGRFVGVAGRLHLTFGVELRVLEVRVWGKPRRGRLTLTSDVADRYANGGLSIGFWY